MGQIPDPIQAKRRGARISAIKAKAERGETTGEERALIRIGKMSTRIMTGQEDLSQWSQEELIRGQRMDKNGHYQGRPPKIVPKALHDELVKRTLAEAGELLRTNLVEAVQALTEIVKGRDVEDKDKLKAIDMIMNRVMGRAPEKIDITVGEKPKWEEALEVMMVPTEDDIGEVIDVDFTEVDNEEE